VELKTFAGELLFSDEDFMAFILLCSSCCLRSAFIQSIRQRPSRNVLCRVPQRVVYCRAAAVYSTRYIRGKYFDVL